MRQRIILQGFSLCWISEWRAERLSFPSQWRRDLDWEASLMQVTSCGATTGQPQEKGETENPRARLDVLCVVRRVDCKRGRRQQQREGSI